MQLVSSIRKHPQPVGAKTNQLQTVFPKLGNLTN